MAMTVLHRVSRFRPCLGFLMLACCINPVSACDIAIDPSQTFQTITGWGHSGSNLGGFIDVRYLEVPFADAVNHQMIDHLVDDFGLTGSRLTELGCQTDGSGNDVGDCDAIDWARFQVSPEQRRVGEYISYFSQRIRASGDTPTFYSSTGYANYSNHYKPWVLNDPGERAQQLWANVLYWKKHFSVDITAAAVANEPGSPSFYTPQIIADDIRALGPRLAAMGLATRIQYAEGVSPKRTWEFISQVEQDAEIWPYISCLSYHVYGDADPFRSQIQTFAYAHGMTTAQTEMDKANINALYQDLTLGGVSYWELSYSATDLIRREPGLTTFTHTGYYFPLRQVIHYVRPGAVRIAATASDPKVRALAFAQHGQQTVVVWNNTGGSAQPITLSGLAGGSYAWSWCLLHPDLLTGEMSCHTDGLHQVVSGGSLRLDLPAHAIATLSPLDDSQAGPSILTWNATPSCLLLPADSTSLSVTAFDPLQRQVDFQWRVAMQPAGAHAQLEDPLAATTMVSALDHAGGYAFEVRATAAAASTVKTVYLLVRADHQTPIITDAGFRPGPPYGLVSGDPNGATPVQCRIALPNTDLILFANIIDPEGLPLHGSWSLVSQPEGAHTVVSASTYIYVSYRSKVSGMTAVGDYVFQLVTGDVHHEVTRHVICSVSAASSGPAIAWVRSSATDVDAADAQVQLTAQMSDPQGDLLRSWWCVTAAPAGARPRFAHQGRAATQVDRLEIPGTYTFTLRAFDDTHMATRALTITVHRSAQAPVLSAPALVQAEVGKPCAIAVTADQSCRFTCIGLPEGMQQDAASGGISGTPGHPGTFWVQLSARGSAGSDHGALVLTVVRPR